MNPNARRIFDTIKDPAKKLCEIEKYEERAAIKEWCGLMIREQAEQEAIEELKARLGVVTQSNLFGG